MSTLAPWPSRTTLLSKVASNKTVLSNEPSRAAQVRARTDGFRRLRVTAEAKPDLPQYLQPNELLRTVELAIRSVVTADGGNYPSLPQIFSACQLLVTLHHKGKDLADKVKLTLERRCVELARSYGEDHVRYDGGAKTAVDWVTSFVHDWKDFFEHRIAILSSMLAYLDRAYLLPGHMPNIKQQALDLARKHIFNKAYFVNGFRVGIIAWSNSERASGQEDKQRQAFISLVETLDVLGLYTSCFADPYLEQTHAYFSAHSDHLYNLHRDAPTVFLSKWTEIRDREAARATMVLRTASRAAVVAAAEEAFMRARIEWVCDAALPSYLDLPDGQAGMRELHALASRLGAVDTLRGAWLAHVSTRVVAIVSAEPATMVDSLLALRARTLGIVAQSFGEREGEVRGRFSQALDDAFTRGFSAGKTKPAEMIAKYLDAKMQSGQSGMDDADFNDLLDRVLALFRYTTDKDVFRTFYTRALARRLLKARSASDEAEKKVIQKLREEHDPEFGKGDEMFKDLSLSKEMLEEFQRKQSAPKGMGVMVLQQSAWPIVSRGAKEIDLPHQMLVALEKYAMFYKTRHGNRKLEWHHSLGTATVLARFPGGNKELSVTLFQAVILLLFNDTGRLSFADVKERTHLEEGELKRTLQSLSLGRHRVLRKLSQGKDIRPEDEFEYNETFTDPRTKLRIPSIQAPTEIVEEDSRAHAQIDGERQYALDAAVVRLMKANRTMVHRELVQQVVEAVAKHFKPQVDLLKKRIEKMIEEGYMERDETQRDKYVYVA